MSQTSIDVKLNLVTQQAAKDLKVIKAELDAVEKGEGEVQSAGKQMAAAISAAADTIEADLRASSAAADALGQALGPELATKLGRSGVEEIVADFKKMGLTAEEIEADVDALAASVKHLDQVGASLDGPQKGLRDIGDSADHAKTKIGDMGSQADSSRSVMSNMVGNTTQDLANLGGVAGTTGLALGQLGEYASEGDISLQGFAKVAGPMLAISIVTKGIADHFAKIAASKAFNRKQVDDFGDALRDADGFVSSMLEKFEDSGKIEFSFWDNVIDGAPLIARAGLTAEQYFTIIDGGKAKLDEWAAASIAAGANQEAVNGVVLVATENINNLVAAEKEQVIQDQLRGGSAEELKAKQDALNKAYEATVKVVGDGVTDAADAATKAFERNQKASDNLARSVMSDFDKIQRKYDELTGAIDDNESWANLQLDFMDLKVAGEEALKGLEEGTEEGRKKILDYQIAVDQNKKSIIDYAVEVLKVPSERVTRILAAVDAGDLERAELLLANLTRNRNVNVQITSRGGAGYSDDDRFATGGMVPGPIGAPRRAIVHGGEMVLTPEQQRGGFGDTYHQTFVMPPGLSPTAVAAATRAYQRRGGR